MIFGQTTPFLLQLSTLFLAAQATTTLLRVPATVQPVKGSIVLNFGGPGEIGRATLAGSAVPLQALSGGQYNLIFFDPRGTSTSNIPFTCYNTEYKLEKFADPQTTLDADDEAALGRLWTRGTIDTNTYAQKHNVIGTLIGTACTARDVMSIAESIGDDGLLRYWGFSYGTTLGATLVSMFPDKVDKVILNGVQNPHEYYHSYADIEEWEVADQSFSGMFSSCVTAGPDKCALVKSNPNATAADFEKSFFDLVDTLKMHHIAVGGLMVDDSLLYTLAVNSLYATSVWEDTTSIFDMLLTGDIDKTVFLDFVGQVVPVDNATLLTIGSVYTALEGIHCSDRAPAARAGTFEKILPAIYELSNTSKIAGRADMSLTMTCAQWKLDAKERYEGDFQVRPKSPVLLIGNMYDGHTPIKYAYNVSAGFEGSVVLEVNGYGHTSLGLPSLCILKTTASYWVNGTLPKPGTVCQIDAPPFSNITWVNVFEQIS
ncbi:conserved hypothetical protein [Talaromyces stipitatus ATCC 10500]|uniref:Peptidase S33 tripeptidyl aminopeptidase-like C-terminal domain-containing protein n=1 Tax=Talaromyces stipitatus (strain ATCC 10500 / CBS 375.48 / QM 6759 / NRRL 1006) TaxID=441959 RepID=B8MP87_TALSN|nr:uncharacterized protein TSTA_105380 [Talaromyces stipitatus ATCC 10500]EED14326.1 conserved hypothetical protein [Talaromyces stipitatus ATCC 10500]